MRYLSKMSVDFQRTTWLTLYPRRQKYSYKLYFSFSLYLLPDTDRDGQIDCELYIYLKHTNLKKCFRNHNAPQVKDNRVHDKRADYIRNMISPWYFGFVREIFLAWISSHNLKVTRTMKSLLMTVHITKDSLMQTELPQKRALDVFILHMAQILHQFRLQNINYLYETT
jgi:hypothetical protein